MIKLYSLIIKEKTIHKILLGIGFLLLCGLFLHGYNHGERILVNDGLGYEGNGNGGGFAQIARNPFAEIPHNITQYQATRLFPLVFIHYTTKALGYSLDNPLGVIHAFYIYNCVLLVLSLAILWLIAKYYTWSAPVFLIAVSAIFINYPILKLSIFHPNTVEVSGLAMGLLTFYLYLTNRLFLLLVASFFASFVWPTMLYALLPLIIFKASKLSPPIFTPDKFANIISAIVAVTLIVGTLYFYYVKGYCTIGTPPDYILLNAFLIFLYIFLWLRPIIDFSYVTSQIVNNINFFRIFLGILLFVLVKICIISLSNGDIGVHPLVYLRAIHSAALRLPLLNLVAHIMQWPVVILIIFLWKDFIQVVKESGLGLLIFITFYCFLSVCPETRQFTPAWPVFAIIICEVLNRRGVNRSFAYGITVICIATSRFWLPNNMGLSTEYLGSGPGDNIYYSFPAQLFFMNFGPWLSDLMYTVFLAIVSILIVCMWGLLKMTPPHQPGKIS